MRLLRLKTLHKIALASAASTLICATRKALGRDPVTYARRSGLQWRLDLREGIDLAIYLFGQFERSTFQRYRRHLRPGAVAVDIGANIGAHTLPLAMLVGPSGRVLAFEPTVYAHAKLCANIALNSDLSTRIAAEQMMLTATESESAPPSLPSSWPLVHAVSRDEVHGGVPKSTVGARAGSLDSYLATRGIERVDFIKLDVDGYECTVLDGSAKTLARDRPILAFELAPDTLAGSGQSALGLLSRLFDLGYMVTPEDKDEPLHNASAFVSSIPRGASLNMFAFPDRQPPRERLTGSLP
jgi:FkbM family methyltransferase